MPKSDKTTTHFGFQQVPTKTKQSHVRAVFDSVAQNYDIMNDLMSFGIHRLWKKIAINRCAIQPGATVLDLAGGTGDLTKQFAQQVGKNGQVYLSDINFAMLTEGKKRLLNEGLCPENDCPIAYVQLNAETLPFSDNTFDCISIAFGLRNVTDKQKALDNILSLLKPGGRLMILEFSQPTSPFFNQLYDFYSFNIIPKIGEWVCNDAKSYEYLVESIRMHPNQETLKNMMITAGFENCSYQNLTNGIVAIHLGFKF